jgi:hypothetical protein
MFKRIGRWLRRIDGWFFRLTDKQRVGVVLGMALFLFSSALYCLGIGSAILLQRPYDVNAAIAEVSVADPAAVEELEMVSTPTALPTPTMPAGSPIPTPIKAIEIVEPPSVPRPSLSDPPARPRVVEPDVKPEAPSQRLPTAVPTRPQVVTQPTAISRPNNAPTAGSTPGQLNRSATTIPAPVSTAASKQPATGPTSASQPNAAPRQLTAIPTAIPKPAQTTPVSKPQSIPTAISR